MGARSCRLEKTLDPVSPRPKWGVGIMRLFPFFAAMASLGATALAQDRLPVTLAPEEAITLRLDESGETLAREDPGRAEWTPFDLAVARFLSGITPPKAPVPAMELPRDGSFPPAPAAHPGRLRLRLMSIAGQHSMLILENGYDRAIVFRARMTRGGETRSTDVCLVRPMRFGFEHWPQPLDRIEISDIRFVPWRAGDPVPCA
jgi:hypothetical protein